MGPKLRKNAPLEHDFRHIFLRLFGKMGDFLLFLGIGYCFGIILGHLNAKSFNLGRHEAVSNIEMIHIFSDFGTFWLFSTSTIHSIYTYNTFSKCSTTQSLPSIRAFHWN